MATNLSQLQAELSAARTDTAVPTSTPASQTKAAAAAEAGPAWPAGAAANQWAATP
jgi:hypothetical protein